MKVSVIVPTYNGAHKLPALLEAVQKQTLSTFELIIVVDGSTDNTKTILDNYQNKFSSFKMIFQENKGRAAVRNRGAKEASGELYIFFDDDMAPTPDSIARHLAFHQSNMGLCTGNQKEKYDKTNSDIQNYKAHLSEKWMAPYPAGISKLNNANLFFTAANCSIKRTDFESLKGFDQRLTDAEDFDLAYRAIENGIAVFLDRDNVAWHRENYTIRKLIARQRQYQQAHDILMKLHPEWRPPVKLNSNFKDLFYGFFRLRFWLWLSESSLMKPLPRPWRYKIYDWITYAYTSESRPR